MYDVVVLSKNAYLLESCLSSLDRQTVKPKTVLLGWTQTSAYSCPGFKGLSLAVKPYLLEYNFAKNCNYLAKQSSSDCLLFLNDDVELAGPDTCSRMLDAAMLSNVGTVGIKLLYSKNGPIQHAGMLNVYGVDEEKRKAWWTGITHLGLRQPSSKFTKDICVFGNTLACCMVQRTKFMKHMLNEGYQHCFEDVEFNIQMILDGFQNICLNSIYGIHYESQTRHQAMSWHDKMLLQSKMKSNFSKLREWSVVQAVKLKGSENG